MALAIWKFVFNAHIASAMVDLPPDVDGLDMVDTVVELPEDVDDALLNEGLFDSDGEDSEEINDTKENIFNLTTCLLPENPLNDVIGKSYIL